MFFFLKCWIETWWILNRINNNYILASINLSLPPAGTTSSWLLTKCGLFVCLYINKKKKENSGKYFSQFHRKSKLQAKNLIKYCWIILKYRKVVKNWKVRKVWRHRWKLFQQTVSFLQYLKPISSLTVEPQLGKVVVQFILVIYWLCE